MPDDLVPNYTGGIYYDTTGNVEIEHDISVVGYGHDEATGWDYWIIRNSWGTYWVRFFYDRSNTFRAHLHPEKVLRLHVIMKKVF